MIDSLLRTIASNHRPMSCFLSPPLPTLSQTIINNLDPLHTFYVLEETSMKKNIGCNKFVKININNQKKHCCFNKLSYKSHVVYDNRVHQAMIIYLYCFYWCMLVCKSKLRKYMKPYSFIIYPKTFIVK